VKLYMRDDDMPLSKVAGKEVAEAVNRELKAINAQFTVEPFSQFKIWALALILPQLPDQIEGKTPLDMQLWDRAKKAGKRTAALETPEQQCAGLDELTLGEQKQLLKATLGIMRKGRELKVYAYGELVDAYLEGDAAKIDGIMAKLSYLGISIDKALSDKLLEKLIHVRNRGMAETIAKALSTPDADSCFFAAGVAHYVGKKSVGEILRAEGYTVTRVAAGQGARLLRVSK